MKNYIVQGQGKMSGYLYACHVTASSPEIAAAKWQQQFPHADPEDANLFVVEAIGRMTKHWKYDGYLVSLEGYTFAH